MTVASLTLRYDGCVIDTPSFVPEPLTSGTNPVEALRVTAAEVEYWLMGTMEKALSNLCRRVAA